MTNNDVGSQPAVNTDKRFQEPAQYGDWTLPTIDPMARRAEDPLPAATNYGDAWRCPPSIEEALERTEYSMNSSPSQSPGPSEGELPQTDFSTIGGLTVSAPPAGFGNDLGSTATEVATDLLLDPEACSRSVRSLCEHLKTIKDSMIMSELKSHYLSEKQRTMPSL